MTTCKRKVLIISDSEDDTSPRKSARSTRKHVDYSDTPSIRKRPEHRALRPTRANTKAEKKFLSTAGAQGSPATDNEPTSRQLRRMRVSEEEASEGEDRLTKLAPELQQMIATHLDNTDDVVNYMILNKAVFEKVGNQVGRQLFDKHFDPLDQIEGQLYSTRAFALYKFRKLCKRGAADVAIFDRTKESKSFLEAVRSIVLQAAAYNDDKPSLNMRFLSSIFYESTAITEESPQLCCDLMTELDRTTEFSASGFCLKKYNPLPFALQLSLLHLLWQPSRMEVPWEYAYESKSIVYKDKNRMPLFSKTSINYKYFIGIATYMQYHLRTGENGSGHFASRYLDVEYHVPRMWTGKLADERLLLGRKWKGCWTSMSDYASLINVRAANANRDSSAEIEGWGMPMMTLFNDTKAIRVMPYLISIASRYVTLRSHFVYDDKLARSPQDILHRYKEFVGIGSEDDVEYWIAGATHAIPDQSHIPGWRRISFIKCSSNVPMPFTYWAYEGIIVPGGQIMMGRYWNPGGPSDIGDGGSYCGPWIAWNYDQPSDAPEDINDAIDGIAAVQVLG